MSAKKPNISQIDKYLKGELDARAMHQLERQAQDDPFLMDALEGYESTGKNQQKNLADLKEQLAKRIAPAKERSLILWRVIPIAATILLMLGAGYWFFKSPQTKRQYANVIALDKKSKQEVITPSTEQKTIIKQGNTVAHADINTDPREPINEMAKPDKAEYLPNAYNVRPNSSISDILKKIEGVEVNPDGSIAFQGQPVAKARLNGKDFAGGDVAAAVKNLPADIVENLQIINDYGDQAAKTGARDGNPTKVLNITTDTINKTDLIAANKPIVLREVSIYGPVTNDRTVSGKVLDQNSKPVIGATVKVDGTGTGVATDVNGNFKIDLPANKDLIAVNYIGYNTQQVKVGNRDNLNIALQTRESNLNEVVVAGFATKNNPPVILRDEPILNGAGPIYKKDTVEYSGSDYAVRPNAPVEDIIKKLEGADVQPDGSISFQGQGVTKVWLNGKNYTGGNVASAAKNIPADMVKKLQFFNDNSNQSSKTGTAPNQQGKILNIITYPNKKAVAADKYTVRGKVKDKQGAILIGATVRVINTSGLAVKTDVNGNFKIDVPLNRDLLEISYVGHKNQQVKLGKQKNLNITLEYEGVQKNKSTTNCNENPKFKTTYFYNIHIVEQYNIERIGSNRIVTDVNLKKAFSFLNRYNKIPTDKLLTDTSYPKLLSLSNYTNQCLKWYEENKCNNLK